MVDTESSVDILYVETFNRMDYTKEDLSIPSKRRHIQFHQHAAAPVEGVINLTFSIGSRQRRVNHNSQFVTIDLKSSFNGIIGRPTIHRVKVVPSLYHQCMKYLVNGTIATISIFLQKDNSNPECAKEFTRMHSYRGT